MDFEKARSILREADILAEGRKLEYGLGKIRPHSRFETNEHLLVKALVSFMALKKDNQFITEAECRNGKIIDIIQIKKNGNLIAYEIESVKNNKPDVENVDTVEIPLKEMPEKAKEGLKELEKWLKAYII